MHALSLITKQNFSPPKATGTVWFSKRGGEEPKTFLDSSMTSHQVWNILEGNTVFVSNTVIYENAFLLKSIRITVAPGTLNPCPLSYLRYSSTIAVDTSLFF